MRLPRLLAYLWASPNTLLGLVWLPLTLAAGSTVRRRNGVLEVCGPAVARWMRRLTPLAGGASAVTLGHVILARDLTCMEQSRRHELVHVRQYERWGPLFLPLYLASSAAAFLRGRDPYRDNRFEREAYGEEGD